MKPLKKSFLLLSGIACLLCSYLLGSLLVKLGYTPLIFHPLLAIVLLVGAGLLLYGGRQVQRLKARKATWLSPAQAPYVALLAQTAAIWSALFLGYLGGQMVLIWEIRHAAAAATFFWEILVLLLATGVLELVALLVEYWCRIDPEDLEGETNPGPGRSAAYG